MIKLSTIAEQVRRILSGGDPSDDSQLDIRDIGLAAQEVRNAIISEKIEKELKQGSLSIDGSYLTILEDVPVLYDEKKDTFYSDIPVQYAALPMGMGIWRVSLMQDKFNNFVRIPTGGTSMFARMETLGISTRKAYENKGTRLEYLNVTNANKEVLIELVGMVEDFEEDTEFPMPANLLPQIVAGVMQLIAPQVEIPQDKSNNNVK